MALSFPNEADVPRQHAMELFERIVGPFPRGADVGQQPFLDAFEDRRQDVVLASEVPVDARRD